MVSDPEYTNRFLKWKRVRVLLGEGYSLSPSQEYRLTVLFKWAETERCNLNEWGSTIAHMVRNDLTNYLGRIKRLQHTKNGTLYAYVLRYGKRHGLEKYNETRIKKTSHFKNTYAYWNDKGVNRSLALKKVKNIQSKRAKLSALKLKGTSEYSCRSMTYWVRKGMTIEEAKNELKRVQGRQHDSEWVRKWLHVLNSKPEDEKELISLKKSHTPLGVFSRGGRTWVESVELSRNVYLRRNNFSKVSQMLFDELGSALGFSGLYYKKLNSEYFVNGYYVDFFDEKSSTVVEYYGDFWHRNPKKYSPEFVAHGKTSKEIWEYDRKREHCIRQHFNLIVVWESDHRKAPLSVLNGLIRELSNRRNQSGDS